MVTPQAAHISEALERMSNLLRIQKWYSSQCNGDWEHSYGVKIQSLDNPGWLVEIDLIETELFGFPLSPIERGNSESDKEWVSCKSDGTKYVGACCEGL